MLSFLSRPNAESKSDPPTPRSLTPRADESRRSKIKGLFFVELTWNAFCGSHHHCEASEETFQGRVAIGNLDLDALHISRHRNQADDAWRRLPLKTPAAPWRSLVAEEPADLRIFPSTHLNLEGSNAMWKLVRWARSP